MKSALYAQAHSGALRKRQARSASVRREAATVSARFRLGRVLVVGEHFVVLGHLPRQAARRDVQEVQVLFELVEYVADDVRLVVSVDVVMLAAAAQAATIEPKGGKANWPGDTVAVEGSDRLVAAVKAASGFAVSGDVVLLAPAAASMDQFKDYADRGRSFAAAVTEQIGGDRG